MTGVDLPHSGEFFGLFLVFYTEKQTFGVWQTDRWLSRRFIFLCQTWPTFTLRHKHKLLSWYIMSPWKNSYRVNWKRACFHTGFYSTKRLIKDNIQKGLSRCAWSDRSCRTCRECPIPHLIVSEAKTELSCQRNGEWCDEVTEVCCSFITACEEITSLFFFTALLKRSF